ncbi:hypothetical protein [Streptomyces sp. NPDC058867]|uniref:hypothetical protein n=1 Tax=unclassified Streptomyces TaxID=2593676 RepID=UPI00367971C2
MAGIHDDEVLGIARPPVPGRGQPGDQVAEFAGGGLGGVIRRIQADRAAFTVILGGGAVWFLLHILTETM